MRSLVTRIGVITAIVLAACSGDQVAPTAPATPPNFKRTPSTISPANQYRFSFSCSNTVLQPGTSSFVDMNLYPTDPPNTSDATPLTLYCGGSAVQTGFISFDYDINVEDVKQTGPGARCQTQTNGVSYTIYTTGTFTCKYKEWSGTLTVELST